uniref:Helix-turn-helix domain-containing protein n=1 Tax=Ammonifex degensii TaxID=42838 RepID=A0A7C1F439_9THEO
MGIGEKLLQARKAKGLTIAAAEEATRIRAKFLEALEREEFSVLPGRVYAKAFLRTYARYLGLDDKVLAQEFDQLYPPLGVETPEEERRVRAARPVFTFNWKRYQNVLLVVVVLGLLFLFNTFYGALLYGPGERVVVSESKAPSVASTPAGEKKGGAEPQAASPTLPEKEVLDKLAGTNEQVAAGQPGDKGARPPGERVAGINIKLRVTRDRCWMRVITDGTVAFEGEVWAGEVRTFAAKDRLTLRLGNAGVVAVSYNGQELGYLGAIGQVVTRDFSVNQG